MSIYRSTEILTKLELERESERERERDDWAVFFLFHSILMLVQTTQGRVDGE